MPAARLARNAEIDRRSADYLISTFAPASSSLALAALASSLETAFLDRLRGRLDEILGLLEAKAGQFANGFDDLDLVRAGLGQNDVELGLLFLGARRGAAPPPAAGDRDRRGGADAPSLFKAFTSRIELKNCELFRETRSICSDVLMLSSYIRPRLLGRGQ